MVRLFCITQKRKGVAGAMIEAGTAIEVFVQQHHGPHRYPQRIFRDHARRRHKAWNLRAPARLLITAPLDASKMGLDLHFNDGGFFHIPPILVVKSRRRHASLAMMKPCPPLWSPMAST